MRAGVHLAAPNVELLLQGSHLLRGLADRDFRVGIGPQVRHCLDFYRCFLRDLPNGRVDYDARERDPLVESSRRIAIERTDDVVAGLAALDDVAAAPLLVRAEGGGIPAGEPAWMPSSVAPGAAVPPEPHGASPGLDRGDAPGARTRDRIRVRGVALDLAAPGGDRLWAVRRHPLLLSAVAVGSVTVWQLARGGTMGAPPAPRSFAIDAVVVAIDRAIEASRALTDIEIRADEVDERATGESLLTLMAFIAIATLASEDLTCVGVGLLVAGGRIGFASGSLACLLGIFLGDLLLFAAGRVLGRSALGRWPLNRLASPEAIERSSTWLEQRGMAVIGLSRLVPGTRLPTYFAAGALRTRVATFAAYFFVAAAIWTPAVVGVSAWAGAKRLAVVGAGICRGDRCARARPSALPPPGARRCSHTRGRRLASDAGGGSGAGSSGRSRSSTCRSWSTSPGSRSGIAVSPCRPQRTRRFPAAASLVSRS